MESSENVESRQAEASALLEAVETDAREYGYGERVCMQCGKKFIAVHFAQTCCTRV